MLGSWWNLIGATGASFSLPKAVLRCYLQPGVFSSCNEDNNRPAMVFSPLSASLVPEPWTGSDANAPAASTPAPPLGVFEFGILYAKEMRQATAYEHENIGEFDVPNRA